MSKFDEGDMMDELEGNLGCLPMIVVISALVAIILVILLS